MHVAKSLLKTLQSKRYDSFLTETQKINDKETYKEIEVSQ